MPLVPQFYKTDLSSSFPSKRFPLRWKLPCCLCSVCNLRPKLSDWNKSATFLRKPTKLLGQTPSTNNLVYPEQGLSRHSQHENHFADNMHWPSGFLSVPGAESRQAETFELKRLLILPVLEGRRGGRHTHIRTNTNTNNVSILSWSLAFWEILSEGGEIYHSVKCSGITCWGCLTLREDIIRTTQPSMFLFSKEHWIVTKSTDKSSVCLTPESATSR